MISIPQMMMKMYHDSKNEKDLSKIFSYLRNQLELKEKELIELQRKDPSLSGPDHEQISTLLNNIESLHLSTEDGSFLVTFNDHSEENPLLSLEPNSTDIHAINDLLSSVWICQTDEKKPTIPDTKTSMFHHLLSLPSNNFLASSCNKTREKESIFDHLLSLPLHNYLASSSSRSLKQCRMYNKNTMLLRRTGSSLFDSEIYCKEYWINNDQHKISSTC